MEKEFPANLPPPDQKSYSQQLARPFDRTEMDDGSTDTRRQWDAQPRNHAITWRLTWEQLAYFEAWLEYEVDRGKDWFMMPLAPDRPKVKMRMTGERTVSYDEGSGAWEFSVSMEQILDAPNYNPGTSLPVWPDTLPWPESSGYSYSQDPVMLSQIETGLRESRVRFRTVNTPYQFQVLLDAEELDLFQAWVRDALADGVAWFKGPYINGLGTHTVRCKFRGPPVVTPVGAAYRVTAQLETSEAPIINEIDYRYPDGITFQANYGFLSQLDFGIRSNSLNDQYGFSVSVQMGLGVELIESHGYTVEVSYNATYQPSLNVEFGFSTLVQSDGSKFYRDLSDNYAFLNVGVATTQNYVDADYFAEDYLGATVYF